MKQDLNSVLEGSTHGQHQVNVSSGTSMATDTNVPGLLGGYLNRRLIAPCLFSGHCNTTVFNAWLEQELLPRLSPGTILILDNVSFHKTQATTTLVERAKCRLLFLPPYSPDMNPIEKLWANLKRHWRNHAALSLDQLIAFFSIFRKLAMCSIVFVNSYTLSWCREMKRLFFWRVEKCAQCGAHLLCAKYQCA